MVICYLIIFSIIGRMEHDELAVKLAELMGEAVLQ